MKLRHPVTAENAREFVDSTYQRPDGMADDQAAAEKDAAVDRLLEGARQNVQYRQSQGLPVDGEVYAEPAADNPPDPADRQEP